MARLHVCTTESLRAGCEDFPIMDCPMCGSAALRLNWTGADCERCGAAFSSGISGHTVRAIREKAGLSRREFSDEIGYLPSTIKRYEFTAPSKAYVEAVSLWAREKYFWKTAR